jgi:hypothetical protein
MSVPPCTPCSPQPDAHKRKLEKPEERAERLAAEAELAKALEEEGDDL